MEKNAALENFFYKASHDLKQPVRNTKMFANILEKHLSSKETLDVEAQEYLGFITDSALKLESLILDLLEYSSLSAEGNRKTIIEMDTLFQVVQFNLSGKEGINDVEFDIQTLPSIEANSDMIKNLVSKLFSNAIKFRKPDEILKIRVAFEDSKDEWKFSIKDNGIGIAEEQLSVAFDPFKKAHGNTSIKGSGLGLSIAQKIVEIHDGKIWLESTLGEGTTVTFTIKKPIQTIGENSTATETTAIRQTN